MKLTNRQLWTRDGIDKDDTGSLYILKHKFLENIEGEAICVEKSLTLKDITQLEVADSIAKLVNSHLTGENANYYYICGQVADHDVLIMVSRGSSSREAMSDDEPITNGFKVATYKVDITGHRNAIDHIIGHLTKTYQEAKVSSVKWWYKGRHGPQNREMFLEPITTKLHAEFYPGMGDPHVYLERYLKAPQSILLMAGPPGSGKTTLLRHLLCDFNLTADVLYDEEIMNDDGVFQNFLFGNSQLMIIEDADTILCPRDADKNSLMARFLNVSDGLIKMPDKKLVFTTNLTDFGRVDHALIRPGRCFDVLHTRGLNYQEACAAARVAGLPEPITNKEYTVAEIFNQQANREIRKVGF